MIMADPGDNLTAELEIRNLTIVYQTARSLVRALGDVSLCVDKGKVLGLWGESGCGKTTLIKSLLGLPLSSPGWIRGEAWYQGVRVSPNMEDFVSLNGNGIIRKAEFEFACAHQKMVLPLLGASWRTLFQEPIYSFESRRSIGVQVDEILSHVADKEKTLIAELREEHDEQLRVFDLEPAQIKSKSNYELSGGQCQRVALALALVGKAELLFADEPTTMIDNQTRELVFSTLLEKVDKSKLTIILASHNRTEISALADHVAVICKGRVVETVDKPTLVSSGKESFHPYTRKLWFHEEDTMESVERFGADRQYASCGCPFFAECGYAGNDPALQKKCKTEFPPFFAVESQHHVSCWLYANLQKLNDVESSRCHD